MKKIYVATSSNGNRVCINKNETTHKIYYQNLFVFGYSFRSLFKNAKPNEKAKE